jgi:hypothetical protein
MGNYSAPVLNTSVKLYTLTTTESLYRIPTASYDAAFVDIYFSSGSSFGTYYASANWSGSIVGVINDELRNYNGVAPTFTCAINGSFAELRIQSVNTYYLVKAIIRAI